MPGQATQVSLGKPLDMQGDPFVMLSWKIKDGVLIPWLTFNSLTNTTSIDFMFNPPMSAAGTNFTIELAFADLRPDY